MQWRCPIDPNDTVIDLYFKKIYPAAIDSVLEVCDLFRSGSPPHTKQDESAATYERRCTARHARIDWCRPVQQVYDLVRGTNPAPGAWTLLDGVELGVFDCEPLPGDGVAGRVMEISSDGVSVQCVGRRILLKRVRPAGCEKMSAAEWAGSIDLQKGAELGS